MKTLRAGILGCGDFARRHATLAASLPGEVELVAFCDRNEPKAAAFRHQFGRGRGKVYLHHRAMFEEAALDLLFICLPPYGHTDEVALAAQHRVHFLIEKPIALESAAAWAMVRAAEAAGLKTQVGFMNRFGGAIERFKALQAAGEAGAVGLFVGRYFCNALHAPWWRIKTKSGGQMLEQAIHLIDLARYLIGEPKSVYAAARNLFHRDVPGYSIEDVSATTISFASGAIGVVAASNAAIPGKWIGDFRIVAQGLTADFRNANEASFWKTAETGAPAEEFVSARDFRKEQLNDLILAIRTDGETRTPIREGALTLDLALAAVRSAEQQQAVTL